jgi:three-Cys-motif partner protein
MLSLLREVNMAGTKNFFERKREWSMLKDEMLEKYLEPYFEKIKRLNSDIAVIDCFAGKGRFDDGADGSPIIILRKMSASRANYIAHAYFIEEKYANELVINIAMYQGKYTLLKESYQSNIDTIKGICKGKNIFLYVDPYGIKTLDYRYFRQFKESQCKTIELLLNFNTFGFLREGCRLLLKNASLIDDTEIVYEEDDTNSIENMNNIANGDYWQSLISNFYSDRTKLKDIEIEFSNKYEAELKKIFKFVVNIPITHRITNIPKYRMYYGTNSNDGLFLMVDQMNRTWKNILQISSQGQNELFDQKSESSISSSLRVFFPIDFKREIKKIFDVTPSINMRDLYVKIIEISGITYSISEYRNEIKTLEKENFIRILRENKKTVTGKISHSLSFEKENIFIERVN